MISVCLITYNHVRFVREAIEGILSQKINFDWELIIADDYSTDGTRDILCEFKKRWPENIKLIFQEKNVGPAKNWRDLFAEPKGKYVAYIEGDDCWTDLNKLQKQVDFLEASPEYVLCSANAKVENLTKSYFREIYCDFGRDRPFDQREILTEFYSPSLSLVFRNRINDLPNWLYEVRSGDTFLQFLLSKYGKFYYMNFIAGIYRQHNNGISNLNNKIEWYQNNVSYLFKLKEYVEDINKPFVSEIIYRSQLEYINLLRADRQYKKALMYFGNLEKLPAFLKRKYRRQTYLSYLKTLVKRK